MPLSSRKDLWSIILIPTKCTEGERLKELQVQLIEQMYVETVGMDSKLTVSMDSKLWCVEKYWQAQLVNVTCYER